MLLLLMYVCSIVLGHILHCLLTMVFGKYGKLGALSLLVDICFRITGCELIGLISRA